MAVTFDPILGALRKVDNRLKSLIVRGSGTDSTLYNSFIQFPTTGFRNDASVALGYVFSVPINITVSQLGRLYLAANTQDHTVYIWNNNTASIVVQGTVLASSTSDANNFKWVSITPTVLSPANTYSIVVAENAGGDTWKDIWDSTDYISPFIKRSGYAYAAAGFYPFNQAAGTNIYTSPAMRFTVEQTAQLEVGYNSSNYTKVFARSNGSTSFLLGNSDRSYSFLNNLAIGKGQATTGVALDVSGATVLTGPSANVLKIGDGANYFTLGNTATSGVSCRFGSNYLLFNSVFELYLNYDNGSRVIIQNGTLEFQGNANKTFKVAPNPVGGSAGYDMTIQASSTQAGSSNIKGGTLNLESGPGTGTGQSRVNIRTCTPAAATSLQTVSTKVSVYETGSIVLAGTAPTIAAGAGAGTGPTVTVTGVPNGGKVDVTTGTVPTAAAVIATITFPIAVPTGSFIVLTPNNANTAALNGTNQVYATGTTTTFTINAGTVALTATTAYSWNFQLVKY